MQRGFLIPHSSFGIRFAMRITYIGHATLLIELAGTRVLTDPNFDPKLGRFLRRVAAPGIALDKLPALDAIVVTHAHADHLSFTTLDALPKDVPIIAPPPVSDWLRKLGYRQAEGLAPGESRPIGRDGQVRLNAGAATHVGSRYYFDRWRRAANMYLFDTGTLSCFFAGDTALTDDTHHLVERHLWDQQRTLDLALLPIGSAPWWNKSGFRKGHLTHDDALVLFERLKAKVLVPYHWGTFRHVTKGAPVVWHEDMRPQSLE